MRTIVSLFFFYSVISAQFHNSNFEFSGVQYFWNIIDTFEKGHDPAQNQWNKLFDSPGYKVLTYSEFTKEFFKDKFEKVCNSNFDLNDSRLSQEDRYYLNHYKNVIQNRQKLDHQINRLKSSNLNNQAVNMALNYLPMDHVSDYPPVSFVIFANDGRGYSPIVIDLYASIDWDFVPFLAHEYHHWYRNRILKTDFSKINRNDRVIIEVISQLEAEGVADQIDKAKWLTQSNSGNSRESNYVGLVNQSPTVLKKVSNLFEEIVGDESKRNTNYKKIKQTIPQSGHPTGFFMAKMILETLGRGELIKTVGNPFLFIKSFNNAARMKGMNDLVFSSDAMKIIDELERKYILE